LSPKYNFVSISILREYFELEFKGRELEGTIDDLIFIFSFIGNDFLPEIEALCIGSGGLDKLLESYQKGNFQLISDSQINWPEF